MQLIELIEETEKTMTFETVQQLRVNDSKKQELLKYIAPTTNIKKIDSKLCNNYIKHLIDKGNKLSTIYPKWYYFKGLLNYAYHNKLIDSIPYVKLAKIKKQEKTTTDKTTILKLLNWAKQNQDQEFRQVILLCYYTGARVDNILSIKPKQINNGYLRLWKNKSDNPYSIPIKKRCYPILMNKKFKGFNIKYQHLRYLLEKAKKELNLSQDLTIHTLRHTFCSRLIEKGIDIRVTQQLAGHKSIQTTIGYTHIKNKTLENAIAVL